MDGICGDERFSFIGDSQHFTFVCIEAHKRTVLPLLQTVEVAM